MARLLLTVVRSALHKKISLYILYEFIHFNLSAGTYSIDDFNAKVKISILQQRQDWEPPQIKDLRLVIPEDNTFMASNTIFITLGIQDKYLENTTLIRSTLPTDS